MIFLLQGCATDASQSLTPPTNSGSNTLSCRVNGAVWLPTNDPTTNATELAATYHNGELQILAYHTVSSSDQGSIEINLSPIYSPGSYTLDFTSNYALYFNYALETRAQQFTTNNGHLGQVNVTTLDTVNHIVSGTFSFEAENGLGNSVTISDGRFDIPF